MAESNTTLSSGTQNEQCKIVEIFILKLIIYIKGVSRVIEYSSQYNNDTWSANQVIGPPKVYPRHGKTLFLFIFLYTDE
jgi:hypothetical protein